MINIDKLQNIPNKINLLLPQFTFIYLDKLNLLATQIKNISVGKNKVSQYVNKSIQEITENDLNGVTSIGHFAFYSCTSLTGVDIPDSVTSIGNSTFSNCTSLVSIDIPDSVTSIGSSAFSNCENLKDIYLNRVTPPTLRNTYAIPTTTTIHVPIGSGDLYKNATNWSSFASQIVEDIVIE